MVVQNTHLPIKLFDQVWINSAKERLMLHFVQHLFKLQKKEFQLEGINLKILRVCLVFKSSMLHNQQGTAGETGLIPVYPTLTFPNHYSIAIGLYPTYHGIILNRFTDPTTGDNFTTRSREPKWWLGEPIWETIANQGLKAVTYFWPGSDVKKGSWDCPVNFCPPYNASVPFEERVDTFLHYFDLPNEEIPAFMALYLEDHDSQGHLVGPDDPQITEAILTLLYRFFTIQFVASVTLLLLKLLITLSLTS
ncbi:uncharacterized protein LOC128132567 [Lactuca sativa]|uniref:uncharacterized protein LOC128132567 n=1 Tax=Lactuca sativa TaxID=4236 RepID=UPI000CD80492|nr:uncharacterized protein LOC128132567 [Lactuca sativa]